MIRPCYVRFGSIVLSNRKGSPNLGNGFMTIIRGSRKSGFGIPVFAYSDMERSVSSISVFGTDVFGNIIEDHEFKKGSRIKILGRNF